MKQYNYVLLNQDGTKETIGTSAKKSFSEMYSILNCQTIEIIPKQYYENKGYGRCTMYGDEEARFNSDNTRNPHFNVLKGDPAIGELAEWDVVGNIIMESVVKEVK